MIRLIAAIDRQRGIGKHGNLPWKIPIDEQYFTDQTKTHGGHVLTGMATFRDTYHGHPLKDRHNYILTHETASIEGAVVVHDLVNFLDEFTGRDLWVAGGAAVFEQVIAAGKADELYMTHIDAEFGCDRFFPAFEDQFEAQQTNQWQEQNGFRFRFTIYSGKSVSE